MSTTDWMSLRFQTNRDTSSYSETKSITRYEKRKREYRIKSSPHQYSDTKLKVSKSIKFGKAPLVATDRLCRVNQQLTNQNAP